MTSDSDRVQRGPFDTMSREALAHLIPKSVPQYKVKRIVGDLLRAVALREARDERAS